MGMKNRDVDEDGGGVGDILRNVGSYKICSFTILSPTASAVVWTSVWMRNCLKQGSNATFGNIIRLFSSLLAEP